MNSDAAVLRHSRGPVHEPFSAMPATTVSTATHSATAVEAATAHSAVEGWRTHSAMEAAHAAAAHGKGAVLGHCEATTTKGLRTKALARRRPGSVIECA